LPPGDAAPGFIGCRMPTRDARQRGAGSSSPPVWQWGQYSAVVLAKAKSRIVSPQRGHGSPARP
jgi:hypothetical protein